MSLDDFVAALEIESGQPGLSGAAERVVAGMKKETSQAL
jgi:hypothetical protein